MKGEGKKGGEDGRGGRSYLLQIHSLHSLIHPLHNIHHAPRNLAHRNGSLHPAGHRIDPASQSQQIQPLILLADGVLCVDLCDVVVALLDCLFNLHKHGIWVLERGRRTFLSLSFSVFSSLLAFAAWRFSCFAVNCSHACQSVFEPAESHCAVEGQAASPANFR